MIHGASRVGSNGSVGRRFGLMLGLSALALSLGASAVRAGDDDDNGASQAEWAQK